MPVKFIFFYCFLIMVQCQIANAQYTNIKLGDDDDEPSIMMNVRDIKKIVVATNKATIYNSSDTGRTWHEQLMPNAFFFSGDPCIITDTNNVFYFFSLGGVYSNPNWLDVLVCYRSYDGGMTWIDSTQIGQHSPKDQDKEWAVVDRKNNHIYMTWTEFDTYGSWSSSDSTRVLFSKSVDQAVTWSTPVRLNALSGDCIDDDYTTEGAVPTVGPNGEIYVSWADRDGIKFDRSFDEGNTWMSNDIFVTTQPNGWNYDIPGINRANGLPVTACDLSNSPYHGHIYINWSDQLNGINDTDIWFSVSTDSGTTWSPRKRVNDDPPGKHQFFSWMTVDQSTGYIYIVYYDRRNYTNNKTDVYMARSTDGGNTFTNEKISASGFTPSSSAFFGDYTNITAHNNIVRPVWTRADGTNKSVYTALIDYNFPLLSGTTEEYDRIDIYPNPANEVINVAYTVDNTSNIQFELFDMTGRKVKSVSLPAGSTFHTIHIENLTKGVYSYILSVDGLPRKRGHLIKD